MDDNRSARSRPRRATPEANIQRQIVTFLRAVLPIGSIVHHCANEAAGGGAAARNRQAILRGLGVHAGFSDLIVISSGQVLFLEVKSAAGRLSGPQEAFRDAVQGQGLPWALVRSVDDVVAALRVHGFKTRIRVWQCRVNKT